MADVDVAPAEPLQGDPGVVDIAPLPRRRLGVIFWIALAWIAGISIACALAPILPLDNPIKPDWLTYTGTAPLLNGGDNWPLLYGGHLLGTDETGRDIFSRVIWGGRTSLVVGFCSAFIGTVLGSILGMLAAYLRGAFDAVMSFAMLCWLAFPAIIAVLVLLLFWGHSEGQIIVVLGAFSIPLIYRLIRNVTLSTATREYVVVAKAQGARWPRVLFKEIFPNVLPAIITYGIFTFSALIAVEGALAILGTGIPEPTPSWGNMIAEGSSLSAGVTNWSLQFAPAILLWITLMALIFMSERLRVFMQVAEQKL